MGLLLEAGCIVLENGGTRGTPTLTVFRPADFKSAMACDYIMVPKFKERAQSTRNCGPCQGEKLGSP